MKTDIENFIDVFMYLKNSGRYNINTEYIFMKYYSFDWNINNVFEKITDVMNNGEYSKELEKLKKMS